MPGPVFLENDSVEFRTIGTDDLEFIYESENKQDIWGSLRRFEPGSIDEIKHEYIDSKNTTRFLICDDTKPVGCIWLRQKHAMETWGVAQLGYWVVPAEWGNHYATSAIDLMVSYCFDHRRIRKLGAYVLESNSRSIEVLKNNEFDKEAVHKNEAYIEGDFIDRLYFSKFK